VHTNPETHVVGPFKHLFLGQLQAFSDMDEILNSKKHVIVQEKHKEGFGIRISTNICYFPDV
jgi:hypothetical protein